MRQRELGATGLAVSEIGFGGWQLGNADDWGGMDDRTAHGLVAEALERGITLFDTAPHYAGTHSERLLGEALACRRADVVLVSKFGHGPDGSKDFSVSAFLESLGASLDRLQTDYLDVLLLHNPDPSLYDGANPIWNALESARREGRIRHYGASLDLARDAEACLRNTGSEVLEVLFNIFHQDVRRAFPLIRERRVGAIVKVPLDSGWLTGRFDARSRFTGVRSRWTPEEIAERAGLVEGLAWLTEDGSELAAKAVGFLLSYEEVSCVIPGMRSRDQLRANAEAGGHRLDAEDRERLEALWDRITDGGARLLPW